VRCATLAIAAAVLLSPHAAAAHEVLHAVELGRAVAVKAYFADGEVLAYTQYEVFSPNDAKIPHQKGRTDRNGYLAFVPDAKGPWRVKVVDNTGHGLDLTVDAAVGATATGASAGSQAVTTAAFVLRPLIGLAVIGAVFVALVALRRRKGACRKGAST
jgi:nickel transport protein